MVVVLGREEGHVDDAHGLLEARVEGGGGEEGFVPGVQAGDEELALAAEIPEEVFQGALVVPGLPGPPVGHVRGAQDGGAGEEVVQPAGVELVEVEEVADVLLDGPGVAVAAGEEVRREGPDLILDPGRGAPEALDDNRKERLREVEGEAAIGPAERHYWASPRAEIT